MQQTLRLPGPDAPTSPTSTTSPASQAAMRAHGSCMRSAGYRRLTRINETYRHTIGA
ncbi:hypothetical protein [Xanthomonas sp. SI]|uniref:hypothetical protein n=1 Tax=Xanthomonas sp. SI TaxID=2724123 RepID=UPI001C8D5169|nr:hypothetical protein [Xanthomonas sp. SI]